MTFTGRTPQVPTGVEVCTPKASDLHIFQLHNLPPQAIMNVSDETSSEILELIPKELNKNSAGSIRALGQVLRAAMPEIIPEDAHMALESTARFSNI